MIFSILLNAVFLLVLGRNLVGTTGAGALEGFTLSTPSTVLHDAATRQAGPKERNHDGSWSSTKNEEMTKKDGDDEATPSIHDITKNNPLRPEEVLTEAGSEILPFDSEGGKNGEHHQFLRGDTTLENFKEVEALTVLPPDLDKPVPQLSIEERAEAVGIFYARLNEALAKLRELDTSDHAQLTGILKATAFEKTESHAATAVPDIIRFLQVVEDAETPTEREDAMMVALETNAPRRASEKRRKREDSENNTRKFS